MRFLRTVSTRRLLATAVGLLVAIGAGTTIAVAASGNGPIPKRESLARAVHGALAAPTVQGITADISFTNHLIDASNIQGKDPLLQGATGRLWLSPSTHQLRVELQSDNGDAQVVVNDRRFWVYDPTSKTAYEGTLPAHVTGKAKKDKAHAHTVPSVSQIQADLNKLAQHVNLSGAIPSDVAGQPTYTVQVSPKHDGGLLGDAQLAFDAARGVPLRFAIYARGDGTPVIELTVTNVSFGSVPASNFLVAPPAGSKIVKVSTPSARALAGKHAREKHNRHQKPVTGPAAVAKHLKFGLVAPASLVGLPRQSVQLLDWAGSPAALVAYGQNLGGVVVIEQNAKGSHGLPSRVGTSSGGNRGAGLSLPTVSINGATGHELDTALGTVLTFTRGNVSYTVVGSVPAAAAEAAARAL